MFSIMSLAFFIRPFYKMMLGKKVTFEDLQSVVGLSYDTGIQFQINLGSHDRT